MPNLVGSKYTLERPRMRAWLIRVLADGSVNQKAIARYFDVDPSSISLFKTRHKQEIEAIRQGIKDKTDHLWITHKANQLDAMDQMYSDLQDFKTNRMTQQAADVLTQPGQSMPGNIAMTHGYEVIEKKQVGREVIEARKFDKGLFDAELSVMDRAAKMLGMEPVKQGEDGSMIQNNQFNFYDRSNAIDLYKRLQGLTETSSSEE